MHDDDFIKGMRGQFRGDFSRDTFDPYRHFSRVLMQQGRVQLDADWNEQVSILLHYLRMLGADLMGPHGAPRTVDGRVGTGFSLKVENDKLQILPGHYYVDGIICENRELTPYFEQPDFPSKGEDFADLGGYLIYLDVWERHISFVEDDYIREKALSGPDTASRASVVWQMKSIHLDEAEMDLNFKDNYDVFLEKISTQARPGSGLLRARARRAATPSEPCLIAPEASYRGPENQLYRVEIHRSGKLGTSEAPPTFKWSRENGSVIFPITAINGEKITLEHLGRDTRMSLQPNDWVELVDDHTSLTNTSNPLYKVEIVDRENFEITLQVPPSPLFTHDPSASRHPYIRRWDQRAEGSDGIPLKEGTTATDWLVLEDGIEIQFPAPPANPNQEPELYSYQSGDYWLIPARTATGDVEWPGSVDNPQALAPQGVQHHYAPIGKIKVSQSGVPNIEIAEDSRRKLTKGWS